MGTETIEPVVVVAAETEVRPRSLPQVKIPEGAGQDFRDKAERLNVLTKGVWAIGEWSLSRSQTGLPKEGKVEPRMVVDLERELQGVLGLIGRIEQLAPEHAEGLSAGEHRKLLNEIAEISDTTMRGVAKEWPNEEETALLDVDEGEIDLKLSEFGGIAHDTRNPVAEMERTLDPDLIDIPEVRQLYEGFMGRLNTAVEDSLDRIKSEYPQEKIPINKLRTLIQHGLEALAKDGIKVDVADLRDRDIITWSRASAATLVDNVAQNLVRAYKAQDEEWGKDGPGAEKPPRVLNVKFQRVSTMNPKTLETGDYFDAIFEDAAGGFPEEIVENGFQEGVTQWRGETVKGTGKGMGTASRRLEDGYGIKLMAENYEEDGAKGGRLIVRIPLMA